MRRQAERCSTTSGGFTAPTSIPARGEPARPGVRAASPASLAWGIAKAVHAQGAKLAFTYQGEALGRRVRPLADSLDSDFVVEADVNSEASLDALFAGIGDRWGRLDFVV